MAHIELSLIKYICVSLLIKFVVTICTLLRFNEERIIEIKSLVLYDEEIPQSYTVELLVAITIGIQRKCPFRRPFWSGGYNECLILVGTKVTGRNGPLLQVL